MSADALIIGAGHNGLAAAVRLAQEGRRVTVLERAEHPGGLCRLDAFGDGYRAPGPLHDTESLHPPVVDALGLKSVGLKWRAAPVPVFAASDGGPTIVLHRDPSEAEAELAALGAGVPEQYRQYREFITDVGGFVRSLVHRPAPPLDPGTLGDYLSLARHGIGLRRLGRQTMYEILRVLPMAVADWLKDSFSAPALQELLAAPAVIGTFSGPWSAGTAANLLIHECSGGPGVVGGAPAFIDALEKRAEELGVTLRCGAEVAAVVIEGGRATGVQLADGERIGADVVLACCDPKTAMTRFLPRGVLSLEAKEGYRNIRTRGTTAKVDLAMTGPLTFKDRPDQPVVAARIGGGNVDALERAFDAAKYGRVSDEPHLDIRVPSMEYNGLAPEGHHVVSILVSFAPYGLRDGWDDRHKEALAARVIERLDAHALGLKDRIAAHRVLSPVDIEASYGVAGGQIHHGEHALDQLLFMRPTRASSRYATELPGLFVGSSGCHPGGGLRAVPGMLAADAILSARS